MKKKAVAIVAGLAVVLAGGAWWLRKPHATELRPYDLVAARPMDLSERVDATGTVVAAEKKDLYADYEASVEQVAVRAGEQVKKGQILLTLSSSTLESQWKDAESALKQAQVNLDVATGQLATELALNHVSTNNALQVENDYHQVALAKEQLTQAQQRLDALKAKNDGYYVANNQELFIRAPFDGQVAWVSVSQGDKITPQTLLATVTKPEALLVEAQVDQNDVSIVKRGQKAFVTGKDPGHSQNEGWVTAVSTIGHSDQTGQSSSASSGIVNFPVEIELAGLAKGLRPGMSVDVSILADERPDALAVPAGSVVHRNGKDYVAVERAGKTARVAVELGLQHGKYWEVKSGLSAGDKVAVQRPVLLANRATAQGAASRGGMMPLARVGR